MVQTIDGSDSLAERANELYWSGSMTVDEIVEDLGISRTSLYSTIEPVAAGLVCADCHERMVYTNRTMRDRGVAVCPNCGRESEPGEARGRLDDAAEPGGGPGGVGRRDAAADAFEQVRQTLRTVPPERVALVGGAAALGIIAGALAARVLRGGF